jgi:peptide/nickel transport system permease protein
MQVYVIRRLLYAILTFFGITIVTFVLIHSVPGDPITFFTGLAGTNVSRPALEAIRHEYRLDRPVAEQYVYWLRGVLTLDFGRSIVDRRPVKDRIAERLGPTLLLNFLAFVVSAAIGVPVGLWSGARAGRLLDRGSSVVFFLLYSLPTFWIALLLMQFFAVRLGVLPLLGMTSDGYEHLGALGKLADRARHLILPVTTLAVGQLAIFARFSRSALTEVIRQDFITVARAKGVGEGGLIWRHAARNALLPLITLLGLTIPYLLSGSVIVEGIFQWPGIGLLYFESIHARDYPLVMGLAVATAIVTLLAGLIADLLYGVADPRVRLGERPR